MNEMILYAVMAMILVVLSIMDIIRRKVCIWILGIAVIFRIIYFFAANRYEEIIWSLAGAIVVTGIGILLSHLSGGSVGEGDAWVCGAVVFHMGSLDGITVLVIAFLLAGLCSAILLIIKKPAAKPPYPLYRLYVSVIYLRQVGY